MIQDQIFLEDRHKNFVKKVSENEIVYALKNDDGFATSVSNEIEDEEGNPNEIICFWSDKARAKSCIKDNGVNMKLKNYIYPSF
nr:DUF2750 domain-containing protein [Chryseobacterium sp. IHB B 17019]